MTGKSIEELKAQVSARVDELLPELLVLARDIWDHPELGYEERYATERIMTALERHNVPVEHGIAGLETALHATVPGSNDGPRVAVLAEYDALAEMGHACGHNLIASSAVGTFLALQAIKDDLNGAVELFGTPAEEGGGGKIVMIEKGAFDGVAAALMTHPMPDIGATVAGGYLASSKITIAFHGREAHSAANPTYGINALDALVMAYVGVNGLRQRLPKDVNISNRISHGGAATNIIHGFAEIEFQVRADKWTTVEETLQKVIRVAEGSAAAIGCTIDTRFTIGQRVEKPYYMEDKEVPALQELVKANMEALGIRMAPPMPGVSASSDFGNITQIMPGIQPGMPIPGAMTGPHTPGFAVAAGDTAAAESYLRDTIRMMAYSVIDLLNEPGALAHVQADWASAG